MACIRDKFRKLNIRSQIFLAMVGVSIAVVVALGVVVYSLSRHTIEQDYRSSHENSLQVASSNVSLELQMEVEAARNLLNNPVFKKVLLSQNPGSGTFYGANKVEMERQLENFASTVYSFTDVLVVNEAGNIGFVSVDGNDRGLVSHYYTDNSILQSDWIRAAEEMNGKEVFYGYNVLFESNTGSFSLVKELINPSTQKKMGFLAVTIRRDLLDSAFGTGDEGHSTGSYLILDPLHPDADGNPYVVSLNGSEEEQQSISDALRGDNSRSAYIFLKEHNAITGWELVSAIRKSDLSQESSYIAWICFICGIILILVSAWVSRLISLHITEPLYRLEQTIRGVGQGVYRVDEKFDDSEVGRIGNRFKNMVNNNLELQDRLLHTEIREKESELLLLQSQINPHFLYNTLDALYFMAVIHGDDDIAEMVQALSDTFKLSLNKGDRFIRVRDEIERIRAYMKIQNMRYHDRFDLQLEVDDSILDEKILTFILQPVVENAVYHGLEARVGAGWIHIQGTRIPGETKDSLQFIISDNGVGMEDISKVDKGYGINNIRERIRLLYGSSYGLKFESTPHVGTRVTITVPVRDEGEDTKK
jgi:two-component system sensor histidine kinase YesM